MSTPKKNLKEARKAAGKIEHEDEIDKTKGEEKTRKVLTHLFFNVKIRTAERQATFAQRFFLVVMFGRKRSHVM
ncbi:MAG TPA: hypothetical protein VMW72_11050 [Sedimentisphaerales bacterium]|nr:hypothetical protein [Sedimentisphaerales bacterium]